VQELLQQIDLDYYRSARLLIAHAELEQLRQERPASGDLEKHMHVASAGVDKELDLAGPQWRPSDCWLVWT
jgi:hypothetical protein